MSEHWEEAMGGFTWHLKREPSVKFTAELIENLKDMSMSGLFFVESEIREKLDADLANLKQPELTIEEVVGLQFIVGWHTKDEYDYLMKNIDKLKEIVVENG